jgi:cilia- and flagella-associated protein 57
MKKRNQELEKFKFVLDYKIKELKEQVEPRETHIAAIAKEIEAINHKLDAMTKQKELLENQTVKDKKELELARDLVIKEHRNEQKISRQINSLKNDLEELMLYFQDQHTLKKMATDLYEKYCGSLKDFQIDEQDAEMKMELSKQQQILQERVKSLRAEAEKRLATFRSNLFHKMSENQDLIRQINELRGNNDYL